MVWFSRGGRHSRGAGLPSNGPAFATALIAMEIASGVVLYATALVQAGSHG